MSFTEISTFQGGRTSLDMLNHSLYLKILESYPLQKCESRKCQLRNRVMLLVHEVAVGMSNKRIHFQSQMLLFYFILVFLSFQGCTCGIWRFPGQGSNCSCNCQPKPQPAVPDPSQVCDLHHSSWQRWVLNPLGKTRDRTCILMDTSQICFHCAMMGTPRLFLFNQIYRLYFRIPLKNNRKTTILGTFIQLPEFRAFTDIRWKGESYKLINCRDVLIKII